MFVVLLLYLWFLSLSVHGLKWEYNSTEEVATYLRAFQSHSSLRTQTYSIGRSASGAELLVVKITASPEKALGVPNVKFIGAIHGNEPVGREILLYFLDDLNDSYATDVQVQQLLNTTNIHILPTLNPDGFAAALKGCGKGNTLGRGNSNESNSLVISRNFPDYFHNPNNVRKGQILEAPETTAIRQWLNDTPFILSAALYGRGHLTITYPFDTVEEPETADPHKPSPTPDDDVFRHLASVYAVNHPKMNASIDKVVKNGAEQAPHHQLHGGMKDYNYVFCGTMEVSIKLSDCRYPPKPDELKQLWQDNRQSLLHYAMEAHKGVTGQILDRDTKRPISNAKLKIAGRNMTFKSTTTGEFWRLLLPGQYRLEVQAEWYYPTIIPFNVTAQPKLTHLRILLLNASVATTTEFFVTETRKYTNLESTTETMERQDTDGVSVTLSTTAGTRLVTQASNTNLAPPLTRGQAPWVVVLSFIIVLT